jgi:hypothetical protein
VGNAGKKSLRFENIDGITKVKDDFIPGHIARILQLTKIRDPKNLITVKTFLRDNFRKSFGCA